MNIRDKRTIGEQVTSGLRLSGWVLFTLLFAFLVLGSTTLLLGRDDFTRSIYRFVGGCGLVATSTVMFLTARHWVKWFFGAPVGLVIGLSFATVRNSNLPFLMGLVALGLAEFAHLGIPETTGRWT